MIYFISLNPDSVFYQNRIRHRIPILYRLSSVSDKSLKTETLTLMIVCYKHKYTPSTHYGNCLELPIFSSLKTIGILLICNLHTSRYDKTKKTI